MALFGKKEKTVKKISPKKTGLSLKEDVVKDTPVVEKQFVYAKASVLVRPHVTEKAAIVTDSNVYVFVVSPKATKSEVKKEITRLYKKTPRKVAMTRNAPKAVMRRKGKGQKPGIKKAYVYMKEGETIDIL